jgi:mannosyl-3-phosphoglycerate phosphatase
MTHHLPIVVFSSLDAIPVGAGEWVPHGVVGALRRLRDEHIPLVFHSTKTRAQLESIHHAIEIRHPFIAENGAAVFIPRGYFGVDLPNTRPVAGYRAVEYGRPYSEVVEALHQAADRLDIEILGFSDMSVDDVARDCGLPMLQACLAKLREYDEPFRILTSTEGARLQLSKALRAGRLGCHNRGRYEHAGAPVDPARGVNLLRALYRRTMGAPLTIGLGGGVNDAAWLQRMDIPLIVRSEEPSVTEHLTRLVPKAALTAESGMTGWADFLLATLDSIR